MKRRPAPKPPTFKASVNHHLRDTRVRAWLKRMQLDADFVPDADEIDPDLLIALFRAAQGRKMSSRELTHYEAAMVATTPILASPQMEAGTDDLRLLMHLPEMQDFYRAWGGHAARTGPKPNYAGAKAVMLTMATSGASANLDDALDDTRKDAELRLMFETLSRLDDERARPTLIGFGATPKKIELPSYPRLPKLFTSLALNGKREATRTRVALLKQLRDMDGLKGRKRIGEDLLFDCTDVPAWVQQKGVAGGRKSDPEREEALRGRCPDAGFRMYAYNGNKGKAKINVGDNAQQAVRNGKRWRGYYLATLVDLATGLPVVHHLMDASINEASALPVLLSALFEYWPDCPVERIIGDSAFDIDWCCKLCEVGYGIHPIFRLAEGKAEPRTIKPGEVRGNTLRGLTAQGQLICSAHGKRLHYKGFERAPREGLRPGQASDKSMFRIRASSECGCGTPALRSSIDWSKLTYYPHHPVGRPELYAQRKAYLDRLSLMESFHNRLKSRKLANQGAGRTRLTCKDTVDCLIELSSLSMVAAVVWDQRDLLGYQPPMQLTVPESGSMKPGDGIGFDGLADVAA